MKIYSFENGYSSEPSVIKGSEEKPEKIKFSLFSPEQQTIGNLEIWMMADDDTGEPVPTLCNIAINDDLKGRRLVNMLYAAAHEYLAEETQFSKASQDIQDTNKGAIKSAERNGYTKIKTITMGGKAVGTYGIDIENFRLQLKPITPETLDML
jgi:hypothetical protein